MGYTIINKEYCDVGGGFRVTVFKFECNNETLFAISSDENFLVSQKHLDYEDYADFIVFSMSYEEPTTSAGKWLPLIKDAIEYQIEEGQLYYKSCYIGYNWLPDKYKDNLPYDYLDWIATHDKTVEIKDGSVLLDRSYLLERLQEHQSEFLADDMDLEP